MIEVFRFVNFPIASNCFVVCDRSFGNSCIVVDPGSNNNANLDVFFSSKRIIPQHIILTHEHFDHCWGVNSLKDKYADIKLVASS